MKTKRIVADSIPLALKMVREQLGDNAIIVNTRSIKLGGILGLFAKHKFEVTAYAPVKKIPPVKKQEPQNNRNIALNLIEKAAGDLAESNRFEKAKKEVDQQGSHVQHEKINESLLEQDSEQNPAITENEFTQINWVNSNNVVTEQAGPVEAEGHSSSGPNETEKSTSVFHKKPQMLYQYYSQATEKEKPVKEKNNSEEFEKELINEIKDLRKMMMVFMTSEKQGNTSSARLSKWVNRLKKNGVAEEVLEYVTVHTINSILNQFGSLTDVKDDEIEKEIVLIIKGMIEKKIPTSMTPPDDIRMIKIIGPTGVGKTTSIAKLATEQLLKQKRRVALITTDVYRIGAVEQLKTYAGILNVPIEVARSANELDQAISKLEHYDLIYMDTTGRNYKDEKHRESVREFLHHPVKSENYLALSLTTKYEDLKLLLDEFLDSPVKKLILTKFDETTNYGSILNIAYQYPYHIAYITNGQSVPEDITLIDASLLASSLVGDGL
ncbi:flagellar biosynthesis protein FlhF [Bacillus sp. S3]|uniref:flagellar biosynthesis protein FlhF n=1 Tax=Bacillus sp. S3 TaxID=486398 RepID=UPI001188382A|nr:flagellar biosynthesis protein FlhF [Bacillus sp. S3]QCJ42407.1 flagellar biosynthesis protein FlhF [Bacillus sp. S3]